MPNEIIKIEPKKNTQLESIYECNICKKVFKTNGCMVRHIRLFHFGRF